MIESMIFFPEKVFYEKPESYGFQYEEVQIPLSKEIELFGWFLSAKNPKGTLLFFHGNAGNISNRLYKVQGWVERGFSVFLIDYRGYGKSTGTIRHEQDALEDAHAALHWLVQNKKMSYDQIVFYGESLGTYPAIGLGAEVSAFGVILEAPFTSLFEVAKTHYPFVFEPMMKHFIFSNREGTAKLKAPLFIIHGNRDEICPYVMAGELFDLAPEPKGFLSVPNGMHNDLPMTAGEDFWQKPYEFILKNRRGQRA